MNHSSMGRTYTEHQGLEEKYFGKNGGNLGGDSITLMGGGCFFRYFQSKLANSVFTYALHEKLKARGSKVRAVCAHPGGSDTHLDQNMVGLSCWEEASLLSGMTFLPLGALDALCVRPKDDANVFFFF